eukprot:1157969-Pelagomonas_calceolata.AAC.6
MSGCRLRRTTRARAPALLLLLPVKTWTQTRRRSGCARAGDPLASLQVCVCVCVRVCARVRAFVLANCNNNNLLNARLEPSIILRYTSACLLDGAQANTGKPIALGDGYISLKLHDMPVSLPFLYHMFFWPLCGEG